MTQLLGSESKKGLFCREQNQNKSSTSGHSRDGGKQAGGK
jgi:hypothetical protein